MIKSLWQKVVTYLQIPALISLSLTLLTTPANSQGNSATCWKYVIDLGASSERAQAICQSYPQFAGYCAQQVISIGGSWDTAQSVCQYGTRFSGSCVNNLVIDLGATWASAANMCKNATAKTSQCVSDALEENGFTWEQALSTCRSPEVADALQQCMDSIVYDTQGKPTGISEEAALQQCQRGRRP